MKKIFYCIALFLSVSAVAQDNMVLDELKEYNFPAELLAKSIGGAEVDADHSFYATLTSDVEDEVIVEEAKYNPSQKMGKRWTLLTYNGNEPTKKELKEFNKDHNKKEVVLKAKINDSSWNIEDENDDYLVVSFTYDNSTLKSQYKYLADIKGKAYFNRTTKQLEKVEYVNLRPTKIKPFSVENYSMVVNFTYNDTEKIYQVEKEEINMDAKIFGKTTPVKDIVEYSDYKKM